MTAVEEPEELAADIKAGDVMVEADIEAGDEMVGFGWKDLSKTSSKTSYPEVITENLRKVRYGSEDV